MGRVLLGLPASRNVHTWMPWAAQRTPRPEKLATFPKKEVRHHSSVRGAWEAVAGGVEVFWKLFVGSSWTEPASLPSTLKLGKFAMQHFLTDLSSFGGLECSEQSLGAKVPQREPFPKYIFIVVSLTNKGSLLVALMQS
eukprot:1137473-Pelagomonas_calceolata.AAC.1